MSVPKVAKAVAAICGAAMLLTACGQSSSDQHNWKSVPEQTMTVGTGKTVVVSTYAANGKTPREVYREEADGAPRGPLQEDCTFEYGSKLTALKESGDDLLVRYNLPSGVVAEGDLQPCGEDSQVIVSSKYFASMPADYERETKAIADSKNAAKYLIAHPTVDPIVRVVGESTDAYETPVTAYLRGCVLESNEYVQSVGSVDGQTLVKRVLPKGEYKELTPPTAFAVHCYDDQLLVDSGDFNKMPLAPKDLVFQK